MGIALDRAMLRAIQIQTTRKLFSKTASPVDLAIPMLRLVSVPAAPVVDTTPTPNGFVENSPDKKITPSSDVRALTDVMRETRKAAADADWDGDTELAERLWRQYEDQKRRHLNGELYEVPF